MRGNRHRALVRRYRRRSIPACAGEPIVRMSPSVQKEVYPRVCGGTHGELRRVRPVLGLSPRVRGNLATRCPACAAKGSIPACAGEPCAGVLIRSICRVYPRVCGGTTNDASSGDRPAGLSPRVRGNLDRDSIPGHETRSIPACAGEPSSRTSAGAESAVYPRVCGGTRSRDGGSRDQVGLSPRVRGNPFPQVYTSVHIRSIPACAGEPFRQD